MKYHYQRRLDNMDRMTTSELEVYLGLVCAYPDPNIRGLAVAYLRLRQAHWTCGQHRIGWLRIVLDVICRLVRRRLPADVVWKE